MDVKINYYGQDTIITLTPEQIEQIERQRKKNPYLRQEYFQKEYYTISSIEIQKNREEYTAYDNMAYAIGNYFTIRKEAEKMQKLFSLILRINRWKRENNATISERDLKEASIKYYIHYDITTKEIEIDYCRSYSIIFNFLYFNSAEKAQECLDTFKKELLEIKDYL